VWVLGAIYIEEEGGCQWGKRRIEEEFRGVGKRTGELIQSRRTSGLEGIKAASKDSSCVGRRVFLDGGEGEKRGTKKSRISMVFSEDLKSLLGLDRH